jgi:hypothetical protein
LFSRIRFVVGHFICTTAYMYLRELRPAIFDGPSIALSSAKEMFHAMEGIPHHSDFF